VKCMCHLCSGPGHRRKHSLLYVFELRTSSTAASHYVKFTSGQLHCMRNTYIHSRRKRKPSL
jgi:hypothetical protein